MEVQGYNGISWSPVAMSGPEERRHDTDLMESTLHWSQQQPGLNTSCFLANQID